MTGGVEGVLARADRAPRWGAGRARTRRRRDGMALGVALAVFLVGAAACRLDDLTALETGYFRVLNDLGDSWSGPAQVVARLGEVGVVIATVVACLAWRAWSAAIDVVVTCSLVVVVNRRAKAWVGRGRPGDLLSDLHLRGHIPDGFGYPSGHTAAAAALATALAPHLPRRLRWLLGLGVALVALARIHVGAHLPLDVVGGAAVGVAVGSAVHLALGLPAPRTRRPAAAGAGRPGADDGIGARLGR